MRKLVTAGLLIALSGSASATLLINERNASSIYTWETDGTLTLFHQTQANDADYNPAEGSGSVWIGEHFADDFKSFTPGTGTGIDASYDTPYAYPKHVTVYNDQLVVMSRNDSTLHRYDFAGSVIGSLNIVAASIGQGMATDGESLFVSLWDGNNSFFQQYDAAFNLIGTFANPTGLDFSNIFDFAYDAATDHFFGLAANYEQGTLTESSTIVEFTMGGTVHAQYALNILADGIGQFGAATGAVPLPATLALFGLGIGAMRCRRRKPS